MRRIVVSDQLLSTVRHFNSFAARYANESIISELGKVIQPTLSSSEHTWSITQYWMLQRQAKQIHSEELGWGGDVK